MSRPRAPCTGLLQMFSEGLLNLLGSVRFGRGSNQLLPNQSITAAASSRLESVSYLCLLANQYLNGFLMQTYPA